MSPKNVNLVSRRVFNTWQRGGNLSETVSDVALRKVFSTCHVDGRCRMSSMLINVDNDNEYLLTVENTNRNIMRIQNTSKHDD